MKAEQLSSDAVARELGVALEHGLTTVEAAARRARFGENALPAPRRERWLARLVRQLREPMALLLVVAAAVAGLGLGETADALAILAIVVVNATIGVLQEGKAERALEELRRMGTPTARVVRDGRPQLVPARQVVPGDLVLVAEGDRVPADLRLAAADALAVDESLLTGESLPVDKDPAAISGPLAGLGERPGMLLSGTSVVRGAGRGIAVATGTETELGRIAGSLARAQPPTPVQRELARLTARLGGAAVVIAAAVFGLTLLRAGGGARGLEESFLAAVALAVAAVPEGLATVVTVALALGVRRMAARGAIVRRLPAVETLGSTTVILTDKTGTLTENRLRLETVRLAAGGGDAVPFAAVRGAAADAIAEVAALCNDAALEPRSGDPLDVALLEPLGAARVAALRSARPRLAAVPFASDRRRMTTVHRAGDAALLLVKGAPEVVLERCTSALDDSGAAPPLSGDARRALLDRVADDARRGRRVLALARRSLPAAPPALDAAEEELTLVALAELRDAVRGEARRAVAEARAAGIRLVMVTGDHPGTASWVAEEIGLAPRGAEVLTGAELRARGLPADPLAVAVYARVEPQHKLALVEALRARGHVVAVTGDGVNDAPALRRADIGVAMGRGSDVARESGDLVITDDDLATIVTAIREGRGIWDNLRKVVDYLVAGNLSEITVVVAALLLFPELGVPLLPLQLLWINLLTDGLPALALGVDPVDPALMSHPPRRASERLVTLRRLGRLGGRALVLAGATIGALAVSRYAWDEPWSHARATMFTALVAAHLCYALAVSRAPNRWLAGAVALGLGLQVLIMAWPPAQLLFDAHPLAAREWALVAIAAAAPAALLIGARRIGAARLAPPRRQTPMTSAIKKAT